MTDVVITSIGRSRFSLAIAVSEVTGMSPSKAEGLIVRAGASNKPLTVKKGVSEKEAKKIRRRLGECGAEVKLE